MLISRQKGSTQRVSGTIQNTDISIYYLIARCNFCFLNNLTGRKVHILHCRNILCPRNINHLLGNYFFPYRSDSLLNDKSRLLFLFRIHYPYKLTSLSLQSRNTYYGYTFSQSKSNVAAKTFLYSTHPVTILIFLLYPTKNMWFSLFRSNT